MLQLSTIFLLFASTTGATDFSSIHFCSDLKPQLHVNIEQITGMWYSVEVINHKQEEDPELTHAETCPILYITDDSTPSTSAPNLYNDYNSQRPQVYGHMYGHGYQDRTYTNTDSLNRDRDINQDRDRDLNRDVNDELYNRHYNYPYQEQTAEEIAAQEEYDRQVYMRMTNPNYNPRSRYGTPVNAAELARRRALYGDIRRLRLLWDENGSGVEYTMRYNVSTAGFWISSGPQNGSALESQYNHFAGTVQVLKAVGNHMVLSFCHQLPDRQLYTVILSRVPMLNKQEIHGVHNLLNRKGLSTSNVRKVCAHSGYPGGAACIMVERGVVAVVGIVLCVRVVLCWEQRS